MTNSPTISVSIFEDHEPLRNAMYQLISGTPGFRIAGTYPDTSNLLANLETNYPDIVIMDINLPGMNGIESVGLIREAWPELPVLMLTVFDDEDRIFKAICAGANGYLLKNTPPGDLLAGLRNVSSGNSVMSPAIAGKVLHLLRKFGGKSGSNPYALTGREIDVLEQLSKGLPSKLIASVLEISYETVRSHLKVIYSKLHVASRTEAVSKAIREGLL